jgi:hypothetical protein
MSQPPTPDKRRRGLAHRHGRASHAPFRRDQTRRRQPVDSGRRRGGGVVVEPHGLASSAGYWTQNSLPSGSCMTAQYSPSSLMSALTSAAAALASRAASSSTRRRPLGRRYSRPTGHVKVEVHPVLDDLWFRHSLKVHTRRPSFGVDDRACVVPAVLGDAAGWFRVVSRFERSQRKPSCSRSQDVLGRQAIRMGA